MLVSDLVAKASSLRTPLKIRSGANGSRCGGQGGLSVRNRRGRVQKRLGCCGKTVSNGGEDDRLRGKILSIHVKATR